jgi:hypothetical protein
MIEYLSAAVGVIGASAAAIALSKRTRPDISIRDVTETELYRQRAEREHPEWFPEYHEALEEQAREDFRRNAPPYDGPRGDVGPVQMPPNPDGYGWISGKDTEQ